MIRSARGTTTLLAVLAAAGCELSEAASAPIVTSDPGEELNPSFSPDARAVVYQKLTGPGNSDIFIKELGDIAVNLTADFPGNDVEPAFSPDGSMVAFRSAREGGGIFVVPVAGGPVRRIADEGYDPAWTRDGNEIVYSSNPAGPTPYGGTNNSFVGAVSVSTGAKRRISQVYAVEPSVSPNGMRIAFRSLGDGNVGTERDIWTMRMDGSDVVRVTDDPAIDWSPVWSPEGDALYFGSNREGGAMKIWRVAIDEASGRASGSPELVTDDAGAQIRGQLSISAKGHLSYIDRTISHRLIVNDLDPAAGRLSGEGREVTFGGPVPVEVAVSPDGEWLAFVTGDSKQEDVYVARKDGSELRQLTNDPFRDRVPSWSPDGRKVGFRSDRAMANGGSVGYQPFEINVDGTGLKQLGNIAVGSVQGPIWSPDGRWIVTTSTERTGGVHLFVMHADGSGVRELASAPSLSAPVWSPDSRRVAYREIRGNDGAAFVVDVTRPVATPEALPELNFEPTSWSSDGGLLAGTRVASGGEQPSTMIYDFSSREYEEVAPAGAAAALLPGGSHLVTTAQSGTRLQLVDRASKATRDVVGVSAPSTLLYDMSKNGQVLVYIVTDLESNVHQLRR